MTSTRHPVTAAALALAILATGSSVALDSGGFSMELLVDGVPLDELHARGTTYVEALPEAEYEIRLRNGSPHRVAVALAVDGLNTVDARTTSPRHARKWVLDPWQSVTISGWQTDSGTARRFFFTTEDRSYGAWLGRTSNLGVVEAVVFRERPARPFVTEKGTTGGRDAAAGAPASPEAQRRQRSEAGEYRPAPADDYAATGIGREVSNPVYQVHMDLERQPAAELRLRYEYRRELLRLGVLRPYPRPDPLDRREQARGFCPDPYR